MDENLLTTTNNPASLATPPQEDAFKFDTTGNTATTVKVDPKFAPASSVAITPDDLEPVQPVVLQQPPEPTEAPSLAAELEVGAEAVQDAFTQAQATASETAETASTNALSDYLGVLEGAKGFSQLTADAYAAGVDNITPELNDINDQIRREQLSNRRAKELIQEKGGGLAGGALAEIANLDRVSLAKQADMAIIQMAVQGKYDSAKAIADRAVAAQLEIQTNKTNAAKFFYEENRDLFTLAEQREFNTLLGNRERDLQAKADNLSEIKAMAIQAQQAGAPSSVVAKMLSAGTLEEADALGGSFLRPVASTGDTKAPTTKNFGTSDEPVWKQFNPATGAWEDVSGIGGNVDTPEEVQKSLDQFTFIRGAITDAQKLTDATGPNLITQGVGNVFVGNTRVKQLATILDSLKVNLLTLTTDPAVKQFFGPQMSDNDSRLMLAGGTTMDAYTNTEAGLTAELARYDGLMNRIQTKVKEGQKAQQAGQTQSTTPGVLYQQTDPDGNVIDIIPETNN